MICGMAVSPLNGLRSPNSQCCSSSSDSLAICIGHNNPRLFRPQRWRALRKQFGGRLSNLSPTPFGSIYGQCDEQLAVCKSLLSLFKQTHFWGWSVCRALRAVHIVQTVQRNRFEWVFHTGQVFWLFDDLQARGELREELSLSLQVINFINFGRWINSVDCWASQPRRRQLNSINHLLRKIDKRTLSRLLPLANPRSI